MMGATPTVRQARPSLPGKSQKGAAAPAGHPGSLGSRMKRLRRTRGMTQEDFAERIAVSSASVSGWEADRFRPQADRLQDIAQMFGITLSELLGLDDRAELHLQIELAKRRIARTAGVSEGSVRIQIRM